MEPMQARQFACRASDVFEQIELFADLPSALADVDFALATSRRVRRGWQTFYDVTQSADAIARAPSRATLVFGSEADGLSTEELRQCHATLTLDLPGTYPSLNLSHAVAVVGLMLHAQLAQLAHPASAPAATGGQRRALLSLWEETLAETGYFERLGRGRFTSKLQALVNNLAVTGRDVQLLAGMLKHWRGRPKP